MWRGFSQRWLPKIKRRNLNHPFQSCKMTAVAALGNNRKGEIKEILDVGGH